LGPALYVDAYSQMTFQKSFGDTFGDEAHKIMQTVDSGFVITGYTSGLGSGGQDAFLMKTDKDGNEEWFKTYGGLNQDIGNGLCSSLSGGYIMAGYTGSYGAGFDDIYVLKADSNGNTLWSKALGGAGTDRANSVTQSSDGSIYIAGDTYSYGSGSSDGIIIKTDSAGNVLWSKTFGGALYEIFFSIVSNTDGSVLALGATSTNGVGNEDFYLVKIDANGNLIWSKTYGGISWDQGRSIYKCLDGGYVLCGFTQSFDKQLKLHTPLNVYVIKVDSMGNTQWARALGAVKSENVGYDIIQTADSGFVIAGYSGALAGDYRSYLVKLDVNGQLLWSKMKGAGYWNALFSVTPTFDGGLMIAGSTNGYGSGAYDITLTKTSATGNTACYSADANTLIKDTLPEEKAVIDSGEFAIVMDTAFIESIDTFAAQNDICDNLCRIQSQFSVSSAIACPGDTVFLSFTGAGTGILQWKFGDSLYGSAPDTFLIVDSIDDIEITLYMDSSICSDSADTLIVVSDTVYAYFSYEITNLDVDFVDSSFFASSFFWDFGDGNTASVQDTIYTYADTGTYLVCHWVSNSCNTDTLCELVQISCKYPISIFGYNSNGLTVVFNSDSTQFTDTYYWIFGDGNSSSNPNPTHTYTAPGTYNVCLITNNSCGSDALCVDITVSELVGITEALDANNIYVFSDNAAGQIVVTFEAIQLKNKRVYLINSQGQKLNVEPVNTSAGNQVIFDCSSLSTGLYFVLVNLGEMSVIKKVVYSK